MNILIVEDDISTRALLKMILEKTNNTVVEAMNATAALDCLKIQKVDLIITDIYMPKMDGLEFIRQIKKSSDTAQTPIVVCTCVTDETLLQKARELGVVHILHKPINTSTLLQTIAMLQHKDLPILEDSQLTVRKLGLDIKGYHELLTIMVDNAYQRIIDIRAGLQNGEGNGFETFLRDLYTSAESLGAKALSHAAMVTSMVIPDAEKEIAEKYLTDLKLEIEKLRADVSMLED